MHRIERDGPVWRRSSRAPERAGGRGVDERLSSDMAGRIRRVSSGSLEEGFEALSVNGCHHGGRVYEVEVLMKVGLYEGGTHVPGR